MAARKSIDDKVIDAGLALAAAEGWGGLTLGQIAHTAKVSLADLHDRFSSKGDIVRAYSRRTDVRVLRAVDPEDQEGERPKDRIFDVLMLRFDELQHDKQAVAAIARAMSRDPFSLLASTRPAVQSMQWMLEAASIDVEGMTGAVRARVLGAVWLAAFRVWLDDGEELAKTMAELDHRLQQSSALWGQGEAASAEA
ncbi:MAG: TetR family transcriptional regulator [Rhodobiaceae bacterium]|nr:MAG: TetR family transcriptional regulator [Rhodobiaceae bacterium]